MVAEVESTPPPRDMVARPLLNACHRGLPALLKTHSCGGRGADRVPPWKPSNRDRSLGRMAEPEEAPSGLEPLYEALQASA
jgi:hypothetical protein